MTRSRPVTASATAPRLNPDYASLALAAVLTGISIWACLPTLVWTVGIWRSDPDYTHGYLVVPLALLFLWARRDDVPEGRLSLAGLLLVGAALGMRLIAARFYLREIDAWSIPVWIGGTVLALCGWRFFKWAAPAIFFLWFATPMPGTIAELMARPLQLIAAECSALALQLAAQPAVAEGSKILLGEHVMDVERACSGLRLFYGVAALAVAYVILTRKTGVRAVVLLAIAAPVAIVANVARVTLTALLYEFASSQAAQRFSHDFAGLVMIPVALGCFMACAALLDRGLASLHGRGGTRGRLAMRWAAVLALIITGLWAWWRVQHERSAKTLLIAAEESESANQWERAVDYYERYLAARPSDNQARLRMVHAFDQLAAVTGSKTSALSLYRQTWQRMPNELALGRRAAQLALEAGQYPVAIQLADQLLQHDTTEPDPATIATARRVKAAAMVRLLESGRRAGAFDWTEAQEALRTAIEADPHDCRLYEHLAHVYHERLLTPKEDERVAVANHLIDEMVRRNPDDPMALLARYRYWRTYSQPEDLVSSDPSGDLERAEQICREDPTKLTVELCVRLATVRRERNELAAARDLLRQCIERFPADERSYLILGEMERGLQTATATRRAVAILEQGVRSVGTPSPLLLLSLAYAVADSGDLARVDQLLAEIQAMLPRLRGPSVDVVTLGVADLRARIAAARGHIANAASTLRAGLARTANGLTSADEPSGRYGPVLSGAWSTLAGYYDQLQMFDMVADCYQRAGQLDPEPGLWKYRAAHAWLRSGNPAEAARLLDSMDHQCANSPVVLLARVESQLMLQADRPHARRDWSAFQRLVEQASLAGAASDGLLVLQSRAVVLQGDHAKAIEMLETAVTTGPGRDSPMLWERLAWTRGSAGDAAGALDTLDHLVELTGDLQRCAILRSRLLSRMGHDDEAVLILRHARGTANDEQARALCLQEARLLAATGQTDQARQLLEQSLTQSPGEVAALTALAELALRERDWQELEQLERRLEALEHDVGTTWLYYRIKRLISQSADRDNVSWREIMRLGQRLESSRPEWPLTHVIRGDIERSLGNLQDAYQAYRRAWDRGIRTTEIADRLLGLLLSQDKLAQAVEFVRQIRDYLERSPRLFDKAIPFFDQIGFHQEALRLAEEWSQRFPNQPSAWVRLGLVSSAFARGDDQPSADRARQRARTALARACALEPEDLSVWLAAYTGLALMHSPEEALRSVEQLAEQILTSPVIRAFIRAQLYESLGMRQRADWSYRQAEKLSVTEAPELRKAVLRKAARHFGGRFNHLAERLCRLALEIDPEDVPSRLILLEVLLQRETLEEVAEIEEILDQMVKGPGPRTDRQRYLLAAWDLKSDDESRYPRAVRQLEQITQRSTRDELLLATAYEKSGRTVSAWEVLSRLAATSTSQAAELITLIEFWQRHFLETGVYHNRVDGAYARLGESPGHGPTLFRLRLQELAWSQRLTWEEVSRLAEQSPPPDSPPNDSSYRDADKAGQLRGIMRVLFQKELGAFALRLGQEPPQWIDPLCAATSLCEALVLSDVDQSTWEQANHWLHEQIKEEAGNLDLTETVADLNLFKGDYRHAVELYQRILEGEPQRVHAWNNMALGLAELPGQDAQALRAVDRAQAIAPDDARILDTRAAVLLVLHRNEAAWRQLQAFNPPTEMKATYLFRCAVALHRLEHRQRAEESLLDALVLGFELKVLSRRDEEMLEELRREYNLGQTDTRMTARGERSGGISR